MSDSIRQGYLFLDAYGFESELRRRAVRPDFDEVRIRLELAFNCVFAEKHYFNSVQNPHEKNDYHSKLQRLGWTFHLFGYKTVKRYVHDNQVSPTVKFIASDGSSSKPLSGTYEFSVQAGVDSALVTAMSMLHSKAPTSAIFVLLATDGDFHSTLKLLRDGGREIYVVCWESTPSNSLAAALTTFLRSKPRQPGEGERYVFLEEIVRSHAVAHCSAEDFGATSAANTRPHSFAAPSDSIAPPASTEATAAASRYIQSDHAHAPPAHHVSAGSQSAAAYHTSAVLHGSVGVPSQGSNMVAQCAFLVDRMNSQSYTPQAAVSGSVAFDLGASSGHSSAYANGRGESVAQVGRDCVPRDTIEKITTLLDPAHAAEAALTALGDLAASNVHRRLQGHSNSEARANGNAAGFLPARNLVVAPTRICTFWMRSPDACAKGTACTFAHGVQELRSDCVAHCGISRFHHSNNPTRMCAYVQTGCRRGLSCSFAHNEEELRHVHA
eukprot:TRINITY_DN14265_c0_g3_i1.p1 TRINITY_DN14265_c0_g3~~TRINITY_DN14265_c0_g3_i1.p1  ORF type:complete len:496 (+),score=40.47 TRINITY_DN14265_c0_g3_i1:57-1544(+)